MFYLLENKTYFIIVSILLVILICTVVEQAKGAATTTPCFAQAPDAGSIVIVGWAMIIGGFALSFIHPPWQMDFKSLTLEAYLYLVFVIIFGTMIAFWFYIKSLQSLPPKESSLLGSIEPLAAVLTTVFWLKEPFGFFQWVGTACIVGMILLLALNKESSSRTSQLPKNEEPLRVS
jgi:drug/metabolite transporter (DMT)-like permease